MIAAGEKTLHAPYEKTHEDAPYETQCGDYIEISNRMNYTDEVSLFELICYTYSYFN